MEHGESVTAHCASRRSCACAVLSGALLIATVWHVRTGAHPMLLESARGSGNLVSTLSGDTRGVAALSGDTRGVAAPSEDRGPFSWLGTFPLGAGVVPRPRELSAKPGGTRDGARKVGSGQGQQAEDVEGEPRMELNPPHHSGTWKFSEQLGGPNTGGPPVFVPDLTNVPALSDAALRYQLNQMQIRDALRSDVDVAAPTALSSEAEEAVAQSKAALEWEERVVKYYKEQIAKGRIAEMPPLPMSGAWGKGHNIPRPESWGPQKETAVPKQAGQQSIEKSAVQAAEAEVEKEEKKEIEEIEERQEMEDPSDEEGRSWGVDKFHPNSGNPSHQRFHNPCTTCRIESSNNNEDNEGRHKVDPSDASKPFWSWGTDTASPDTASPPEQDGTKSSEEIGGKDRSHVASKSKDDGSTKIWMSALCSVGVIAVIFTYVSLDFHVNDVDIP